MLLKHVQDKIFMSISQKPYCQTEACPPQLEHDTQATNSMSITRAVSGLPEQHALENQTGLLS